MITSYAYYDIDTGVITKICNLPDQRTADLNVDDNTRWLAYDSDQAEVKQSTHKVDLATLTIVSKTTQSLTATPTTIDADGVDKSVISGIAANSVAQIDLGEGEIKSFNILDGKLYFCTDKVGTHEITITNDAYLDTHVSITATAP